MKDIITCPTCGGHLERDAHSLSDPYVCDTCEHIMTLDGEHIPPESPHKRPFRLTDTLLEWRDRLDAWEQRNWRWILTALLVGIVLLVLNLSLP